MNKTFLLIALIYLPSYLFSQIEAPPATPASERLKNAEIRNGLLSNSLVKNVPFKSIGPTIFSGRVSDVDVWKTDPTHFYVAYASGGLWKTENNGQSFTPIFDDEIVMTLGDIAVDWERNIIWAGTGEVNSSRSSYSGVGIYRSLDQGKSWQYKGLPESHHIGRIILHPDDPNILWVAVLGHLYSPNEERGIYKSMDGGDSWNKVLYVNENTGAVDLVMDPQDPNTLYASTWHRERRSWNFVEAGEGSGIYKSSDGGDSWLKLNSEDSGFPAGEGTGRIGLDVSVKNGATYLVAIVDNQNRRPKEDEKEEEGLAKEDFKEMDRDAFLKLDKKDLEAFLKENGFPKKYSADKVLEMVKNEEIQPISLAEYLENANSLLFDTPVIGAEVYESTDGGVKWNRTHEDYLDNVYYSYGYYFGQVRVAQHNPEKLFIFGVPVLVSEDGGKNWKSINGANVHVDHHALWVNPKRDGHLILGNDGGINISYDDGENWVKCNTPPLGQFYHIAVDLEKNYNVYGGLQDNGSWYGPHTYEASNRWHNTGQYPFKAFVGGDGMQTAVDTRDNNTVYGGLQFGNYFRVNKESGKRARITPQHELGDRPYRWNWQTPIHLSKHNQDILYMGANKIFRSMNQGEGWEAISPDLTKGGQKGDVPFGTLSAIHESPLKFGLLYAGTDDGLVHVSKDGGNTWTEIIKGLPSNLWVSRVQASQFDEGTVYLSLNGYRWDQFEAFVYSSEDFGSTWKRIGLDLPNEPVNVIKEDPENKNILYVGTDHGLYISFDKGANFMLFDEGLPSVAVHDVVVHPTEKDLIVGTHGRSLYLTDAEHFQQLDAEKMESELFVYEIDKVTYRDDWGRLRRSYQEEILEPEIDLVLFSNSESEVLISILYKDVLINSWSEKIDKGLNYLTYNGEIGESELKKFEKSMNKDLDEEDEEIILEAGKNGKYYLIPNIYQLVLEKGKTKIEKELQIEKRK